MLPRRGQVFLEGTPRGLRAAKALLPGGQGNWGETYGASPQSTTLVAQAPVGPGSGTPVSPALSSSSGSTPPDDHAGFVRRRFSLAGGDDGFAGGGGAVVVGVSVGGGAHVRHGQRRSMSFGGSSDDGMSNGTAGQPGAGVMTTWTGGGTGGMGGAGMTTWPLSVVANVG